jgi:tetratricopeptide (TPR) repeat protein
MIKRKGLILCRIKRKQNTLRLKKRFNILLITAMLLSSLCAYAQEEMTAEDRDLTFQNHFFEALKHRAILNYQRAIENLESCEELNSGNVAVYFEFAKNYAALKRFDEAIYFIDKALALKHGSVPMLNHKVHIYKSQQKFDQAIEVQQKLAEIDPKNLEPLVVLYMQNKQYDKAEEKIAEIEQMGISSRKISGLKEFIRNRRIPPGDENQVIEEKKIADDIPTLIQRFSESGKFSILTRLLTLLKEAENYEELSVQSDAGLELYPAQPQLYYHKAKALVSLGKYNEAIDVLTIGIDFVVDNLPLKISYFELFEEAYRGLNNEEKAREYKERAATLRGKTQ